MPTALTQNWLVNIVLPTVALATISFSAFAVWRHGWFSPRPVLSIYIWVLAITGALSLVVYYLQVPEAFRYAACRAYLVIYNATVGLMCFFSVAVLYEFLFRMAETNKTVRRTAVIGFVITISGIIALTYALMAQPTSTPRALTDGARFLYGATALALLASGALIFAIKRNRSFFLETRLSVVLAAVTLYNFIDLSAAFTLRRSEQTRLVMGDVIWICFSILLYRALKNGPAISSTAANTVELPAKT
jgi:hypothetical protein